MFQNTPVHLNKYLSSYSQEHFCPNSTNCQYSTKNLTVETSDQAEGNETYKIWGKMARASVSSSNAICILVHCGFSSTDDFKFTPVVTLKLL